MVSEGGRGLSRVETALPTLRMSACIPSTFFALLAAHQNHLGSILETLIKESLSRKLNPNSCNGDLDINFFVLCFLFSKLPDDLIGNHDPPAMGNHKMFKRECVYSLCLGGDEDHHQIYIAEAFCSQSSGVSKTRSLLRRETTSVTAELCNSGESCNNGDEKRWVTTRDFCLLKPLGLGV